MIRPLEGITVVALEQVIAGPFCTRQLAELGARVIKIERPGVGDAARGYDRTVKGLSSHFVWTNRSKESLALDVKHPEMHGHRRWRTACRRRRGRGTHARSRGRRGERRALPAWPIVQRRDGGSDMKSATATGRQGAAAVIGAAGNRQTFSF